MFIGATHVEGSARPRVLDLIGDGASELREAAEGAAFWLSLDDDALVLRGAASELGTLRVDFTTGRSGWRGGGRAQHERLVRATGAARTGPNGRRMRIVDGTGGLGTDAWLMASAGAEVTILEHHPVIRALLADALRRSAVAAPDTLDRLRILAGDTRTLTSRLDADADVLYLDPMYPPRRKQALGDQRLRLLSALLRADALDGADAAGLVAAGLDARVPRIVLKRPRRVAIEGLPRPNHTLEGRSTSFDVWISPLHPD